ncbi:hypothetical protein GALMADRAFT_1211371 [Galerina marginata CBS 339.88]|uniref:Secreted protein n=1 Tax=Galerina marginata (strain CBS 339.88) TaxID=685588 RepID=A0A067SEA6_GALM3|nr:hypothetical protein GALMADRAFT_1211371 [Galerina marginata CBS 339.88]
MHTFCRFFNFLLLSSRCASGLSTPNVFTSLLGGSGSPSVPLFLRPCRSCRYLHCRPPTFKPKLPAQHLGVVIRRPRSLFVVPKGNVIPAPSKIRYASAHKFRTAERTLLSLDRGTWVSKLRRWQVRCKSIGPFLCFGVYFESKNDSCSPLLGA